MSRNLDTFTAYLRKQIQRQDHVGDFARDWTNDTHCRRPRGAFKWKAVERYLIGRGAVQNCVKAANEAWNNWKKVQKS